MDERERFAALYRTFHPHVLRYLARRLPLDEVEDVCADVFVRAWHARAQRRGNDPLPWLYTIARHQIADHLAQHERVRDSLDLMRTTWQDAVVQSAEEGAVDRVHAYHALAALSPSDREALMLTTWDGLTPAAAATVTGCNRAAFLVRLHRARKRLAQHLTAQPPYPARSERTRT
ncbi:RNA polymerase sigma factor [Streptomyces sp. G45]|uniref:RNA polymerase sigma factor n=1 Tax=Streptomyces sp. G45 TaxID=3406627 RepID=UPI003C23429E